MPDFTSKSILPIVSFILILVAIAASGWLWLGIKKNPDFLSGSSAYTSLTNSNKVQTEITTITISDLQIRQRSASNSVYDDDNFPEVMLIDVRTSAEYAAGHIENSINIPYSEILAGNFSLPEDSVKLVFYGGVENINTAEFHKSLSDKNIQYVEVTEKNFDELKTIMPVVDSELEPQT